MKRTIFIFLFVIVITLGVNLKKVDVHAANGTVIDSVSLKLDWSNFEVSESIIEETTDKPYQFWINVTGEGVEQSEDPYRGVWIKPTKAHVEAGYLEADIFEETKEDGWAHLSYYSDEYEIGKDDEVRYTLRLQAEEGYYFSEEADVQLNSNVMKLESATVVDSPFYENQDWLELSFKMGTGADIEKVIASPESDKEEVVIKEETTSDKPANNTYVYIAVAGVAVVGVASGVFVWHKKRSRT